MGGGFGRFIEQRTLRLSGIGHDLRTPLTRMKLELAMMDERDARDLLRDVQDMERLVDEFLAFSRGDATEDSDYDIAVFLHDMKDRWTEVGRLADLNFDFIEDAGVFLDIQPYRSGSIEQRTPIMHEIRLDGRDL